METAELFAKTISNLKVGETAHAIKARRDEITKALNKNFRSKEGCTDHKLMVGSFGRHTAIKGVSDLDVIYILPPDMRTFYGDKNGPRRILERVRDILKGRYPNTEVAVDQCVVRLHFVSNAFKFEVQPAFENQDKSFSYPDTVAKRWKVTKPRHEILATKACNDLTSSNMRHLARMVRAWKNAHGVNMGGLLIDTLVHRFFEDTRNYDRTGFDFFPLMVRDFFGFLKDESEHNYYLALGSNQQVKVRCKFQTKATKAYFRCTEAIESDVISAAEKWREVFGSTVPRVAKTKESSIDNAEEFIENLYPVDITAAVHMDCKVIQDGWRPTTLREMLRTRVPLKAEKELRFWIVSCSVAEPYVVKWKVLNRGAEAQRRKATRGQIINSSSHNMRIEHSDFRGNHVAECYIVKDGVVVARDLIDVPITTNRAEKL